MYLRQARGAIKPGFERPTKRLLTLVLDRHKFGRASMSRHRHLVDISLKIQFLLSHSSVKAFSAYLREPYPSTRSDGGCS
jgi:hypothetical protein